MIRIDHLDHLVLTVASIDAACGFYADVLGMQVQRFGQGRTALRFGDQKINLHQRGHEFSPRARLATPGSADLCFVTETPIETVIAHLKARGIAIEEGPVERSGAVSGLLSVYVRDPDGNLVEISNQVGSGALSVMPRKLAAPAGALGAGAAGALAVGATSFGVAALGAFALGAVAIGAMAIGRVSVGRARIKRLEIDELVIRKVDGADD